MSTICSNCGEELIGAVNRCWRCGREFEIDALADIPPVRRMHILPEYLHSPSTAAATTALPSETGTPTNLDAASEEEIVAAELAPGPSVPLQLDSPFRMTDAAPSSRRATPWLPLALGIGGLGAMLCLASIVGAPLVLFAIGIIIWRAGTIPARQAWFLLILAIILLLVVAVRTSVVLHMYFFGQPLFPSLAP